MTDILRCVVGQYTGRHQSILYHLKHVGVITDVKASAFDLEVVVHRDGELVSPRARVSF